MYGHILTAVITSLPILWSIALAEPRPTDEERGLELYERHCIQCHGATAAGDGVAATALITAVPDLQSRLEKPPNTKHIQLILNGKGSMPAFELSFDKHDAKRILKHMEYITHPPETTPEEADDDAPSDG